MQQHRLSFDVHSCVAFDQMPVCVVIFAYVVVIMIAESEKKLTVSKLNHVVVVGVIVITTAVFQSKSRLERRRGKRCTNYVWFFSAPRRKPKPKPIC